MIQKLDVYIWNTKVGTLLSYKERHANKVCFYYDEDFVKAGIDLSPLVGSIHSESVKRGLPIFGESDKLYHGLPSFISDSLPDHWGNKLFAEWAQSRGIRSKDLTALDKLAYIGRRGMGALEFLPPSEPDLEQVFSVSIDELFAYSQRALEEAKNFKASDVSKIIIESLFKVGTSAGGRRPKAIVGINYITGECISGQVPVPDADFNPCIVKFDEKNQMPTTRIEYSYYLMALDAGIKMQKSSLFESESFAHFITERFDRAGPDKVHTLTLAALNPSSDSYEDLFDTAIKLKVEPKDLVSIYRAAVMNVTAANVDDHNKNFSFIMDRVGHWSFAPVYDFTFSYEPSGPSYVNTHSMSINGKIQDISREDLLSLAEKYDIKNAENIINHCAEVATCYPDYASRAGLDEYWTERICKSISDRIELVADESRGLSIK